MLEVHVKASPFVIANQKDDKGFTLLHHAVLKCVPGKVQKLLELARKVQKTSKEELHAWINSRTTQD